MKENFKELNDFFDFLTNNNEELKNDLIDVIKFKLARNMGNTGLCDIASSYPDIKGPIVFPSNKKKYDIINLVSNDEKLKKIFFDLIKLINKFKENYNSMIVIEDDGRFLVSNKNASNFEEKRRDLVIGLTNLSLNNPLGNLVFINRKRYTIDEFFKDEGMDFDVLTLDPKENLEFDDDFLKELLNKEKIEKFIEN